MKPKEIAWIKSSYEEAYWGRVSGMVVFLIVALGEPGHDGYKITSWLGRRVLRANVVADWDEEQFKTLEECQEWGTFMLGRFLEDIAEP